MRVSTIQAAVNGGWRMESKTDTTIAAITCDPMFWKALHAYCGWGETKVTLDLPDMSTTRVNKKSAVSTVVRKAQVTSYMRKSPNKWKSHAMQFHQMNLEQGWDKAVEWLDNLITSSTQNV